MSSPENRNRNNLYKPAFRNIDNDKAPFTSSFTTSSVGGPQYGMQPQGSLFPQSGNFSNQPPQNFGQTQASPSIANQSMYGQTDGYSNQGQAADPLMARQVSSPGSFSSSMMSPQRGNQFPQNNFNDPMGRQPSPDKSPFMQGPMGDFQQPNQRPGNSMAQNNPSPVMMQGQQNRFDASPGPNRMGGPGVAIS